VHFRLALVISMNVLACCGVGGFAFTRLETNMAGVAIGLISSSVYVKAWALIFNI
jgi:hypothetical protein